MVTGNKALLAQHGPELFDLSREREADLYYEPQLLAPFRWFMACVNL